MEEFFNTWYFDYIIVPILIIIARIIDVSLGTVRIILLSKGSKVLAPLLGFFEVLIWIVVIGQIMQNLTNPITYIAYAIGFSLGNYFGVIVENKLAIGKVVIRTITKVSADKLIKRFKKENYGVTIVDAIGAKGPVHMIFTVVKRAKAEKVIKIIKECNPKAFYSIEDIRFVSENYTFPAKKRKILGFKRMLNKRK